MRPVALIGFTYELIGHAGGNLLSLPTHYVGPAISLPPSFLRVDSCQTIILKL